MSANYSINWQAETSGVSGTGLGVVLMYDGTRYVPASTANRALYDWYRGIIREVVSASGLAVVQVAGDVPPSVTGFAANASGYAILDANGFLTVTASVGLSDVLIGVVDQGLTTLSMNTVGSASAVVDFPWVDVRDYDPTSILGTTGDVTAVVQAAVNALTPGKKLLLRKVANGYSIRKPIVVEHSAGIWNVEICGEANAFPVVPAGGVEMYWDVALRTGSSMSLVCDFVGALYLTWTRFQYLTATGLSGLTSEDVGKRIIVTNAARTYWNAVGVIERVNSATSCVIAMPMSSNNVAIATDVDANNGTIDWEILEDMWDVRTYAVVFTGVHFVTRGAGTKPAALISSTYSQDGTVCTHIKAQGCFFGSDSSVSTARTAHEPGKDFLPAVGSTYYAVEGPGNWRRPFHPFQNDYIVHQDCAFAYLDSVVWTGNSSGQIRDNYSINCTFSHLTNGFVGKSRFSGATEELLQAASLSWDIIACGMGEITGIFIDVINPNSYWAMTNCYGEGRIEKLAVGYNTGTARRPFDITNCTFLVNQHATDGWIVWGNGPVRIQGGYMKSQAAAPNGFYVTSGNDHGLIVADTVILTSDADSGGPVIRVVNSNGTMNTARRINCQSESGATVLLLPDYDYVISPDNTQGGKYLQNVLGVSATWVETHNLVGTATVTGAATTAVLTFPTAETTATGLYAWASPIASTGGPAVNSNIPLTVVCTTTTATVTVMAAPGGAATVTFAIFLARGL